jgi:beta-aspartyl-peptidase (threonine type)
MAYKGLSLADACREVISKIDKADPECGGVIALDARGNFAFEFNTPGMYRGLMQQDENPECWIYR